MMLPCGAQGTVHGEMWDLLSKLSLGTLPSPFCLCLLMGLFWGFMSAQFHCSQQIFFSHYNHRQKQGGRKGTVPLLPNLPLVHGALLQFWRFEPRYSCKVKCTGVQAAKAPISGSLLPLLEQ